MDVKSYLSIVSIRHRRMEVSRSTCRYEPVSGPYAVGLDFGTESARGVLLDLTTGRQAAHHTHAYRHGVMTDVLPGGERLPASYALQDATDYGEAAEVILRAIGSGRQVVSIGVDFTASSPLPTRADGTPLSTLHPTEPHAYVKLWKHAAARAYADRINARGAKDFLADCGGRLSGEWMLPKAAELREEAPALWDETERFIEAGDWLVWQLAGREARSLDFAAYKAHYLAARGGYPADVVPGLLDRLSPPQPVGTPAGRLSDGWRKRTGVEGEAIVAVAVIDSHVVLPAVGAVSPGTLVGALGTSAVFLLLEHGRRPLPTGIEAVADGAALPGLCCYEAGQAGFGDMLAWFVRTFPRSADAGTNFRLYNEEAARLRPGENHLVALDWWTGNRVPHGDQGLSGVLAGLTLATSAAGIYRALIEAVCFGARSIVDHLLQGGLAIDQVLLTSGLAHNNPMLVQTMADILAREVTVPSIQNPTAIGAAIHGAVAAGVVDGFAAGARRFGQRGGRVVVPDRGNERVYARVYDAYRTLQTARPVRDALGTLDGVSR